MFSIEIKERATFGDFVKLRNHYTALKLKDLVIVKRLNLFYQNQNIFF